MDKRIPNEPNPFFFTRSGASLSLEGIHRGASAFVIAGGPSFAQVDTRKLNSVWTMTLNNAVSSYRGNAACMVDDPSRFNYSMWLDPMIQKFVPLSSFEKPLWDNRMLATPHGLEQQWQLSDLMAGDCPNVVAFRRNEQFNAARFLYEETINWGCKAQFGGGRSVMLPALRILFLLGFRRIYLLGVDFEMTDENKYHFAEDRSVPAIRSNMENYEKLRKWFLELQPYFLNEGLVVQNCNPASRLEAFPFITFDDAVTEASAQLGNTAEERTLGMYRKLEDKIAETKCVPSETPDEEGAVSLAAAELNVGSTNVKSENKNIRYLILRNFQSPGDIVMLTAAVRDLHKSNPGRFVTDVRTSCPQLWENNPYITSLDENDPWVEMIKCDYPLIHESNTGPWHFIHGFIQFLSNHLKVDIRPTDFKGDIHLAPAEKEWISQVQQITAKPLPFWVIVAGGKRDFTIKWWSQNRYQRIVNHFSGKILFVQVGEVGHDHTPLEGVLDFRGLTDLRQLVRLIHHAQGVVCPVTLAMHLSAAIAPREFMPRNRACVVIAGGREPSHWEAYPHHQFIHTNGALKCCDNGGCWKSRTAPIGDGDDKDLPENLCADVVIDNSNLPTESGSRRKHDSPGNALTYPSGSWSHLLPKCMDLISADDVIRAIELYFDGQAINYLNSDEQDIARQTIASFQGSRS